MEWWIFLIVFFSGLLILMIIGLPIAFSFLVMDITGFYFLMGGEGGVITLILSIDNAISSFVLVPISLFVLMGELMLHSGLAGNTIDAIDKLFGKLPGRLSVICIVGGSVFSALTGSSSSSTAMLGSTLIPEMEKHGYKKPMTLGPILGSGGLAILIPPSALGVLMAALAQFSVGDFLLAIILPGIIMAILYLGYTIIRCKLQPNLAPIYEVTQEEGLLRRIRFSVIYIFPLGGVIFAVIGLMYLGVATPTESAALGAAAMFIVAIIFKGIRWDFMKNSMVSTIRVTVMIFMIFTGSFAFSQLLAYTGANKGLIQFAVNLNLPPLGFVSALMLLLIIMGFFMEPLSIMMITIPVVFPIIETLGFDKIWFGLIMLINMEMAVTSPPFGVSLFVLKGIAPKDTTMGDVYKAGLPYLVCDIITICLIMFFPDILNAFERLIF